MPYAWDIIVRVSLVVYISCSTVGKNLCRTNKSEDGCEYAQAFGVVAIVLDN